MTHPAPPNGYTSPIVRTSRDVLDIMGMGAHADDYFAWTERKRRRGLKGSRDLGGVDDPLHLYKYRPFDVANLRSVDMVRQILVHNQVWMAAPSRLNDPKDMRFTVQMNNDLQARQAWMRRNQQLLDTLGLPPEQRRIVTHQLLHGSFDEQMIAEFQKATLDAMGVFSASRDPRNELIWTHYADEHRGICIQFATFQDELFLLAKRVAYGKEFPKLLLPAPDGQALQEHYLIKSAAWSYENEWRVVVPLNSCAIALRPATVSGIIIGSRAHPSTIDALDALLTERREANYPPVRIYNASTQNSGYDIRVCCGFPRR